MPAFTKVINPTVTNKFSKVKESILNIDFIGAISKMLIIPAIKIRNGVGLSEVFLLT
jgi:hypothetical protein